MKVVDCIQGTPEWLQARCGNKTASRAADIMAKLKPIKDGVPNPKEAADRRNYRIDLVAERLSGRTANTYVSDDMLRGIEQEPFARAAFEMTTGIDVTEVGFVLHPLLDRCGCSPDGLIGEGGMVQFKCPRITTHIEWMLADVVPEEHKPQMLAEMDCCERQWSDFVSYCPELPERFQLFIKRLPRNEERIQDMRTEFVKFEGEVQQMIEQLEAGGRWLEKQLIKSLELVK